MKEVRMERVVNKNDKNRVIIHGIFPSCKEKEVYLNCFKMSEVIFNYNGFQIQKLFKNTLV